MDMVPGLCRKARSDNPCPVTWLLGGLGGGGLRTKPFFEEVFRARKSIVKKIYFKPVGERKEMSGDEI